MAENEAETTPEKPAKSGKPWLLVGIALVVGLAAGGVGVVVLRPTAPAPPAAGDAEAADAAKHDTAVETNFAERTVQLEPFVVNVSGEGYPRYLKVQVAFETSSPKVRADLEERMAQVRDLTILLLSSKRLADVSDFEGKALLKDDLREQVNALLPKGRVESVLFTEFVVQ